MHVCAYEIGEFLQHVAPRFGCPPPPALKGGGGLFNRTVHFKLARQGHRRLRNAADRMLMHETAAGSLRQILVANPQFRGLHLSMVHSRFPSLVQRSPISRMLSTIFASNAGIAGNVNLAGGLVKSLRGAIMVHIQEFL